MEIVFRNATAEDAGTEQGRAEVEALERLRDGALDAVREALAAHLAAVDNEVAAAGGHRRARRAGEAKKGRLRAAMGRIERRFSARFADLLGNYDPSKGMFEDVHAEAERLIAEALAG